MSRRVIAAILAAGQSRRMGQAKQLMPYKEGTMLDAVIEAVMESSVDGLIVVVNPALEKQIAGHLPEKCYSVVNADPHSEMIDSVRLGLRGAREHFQVGLDDGIMILPSDQPQVKGGVITTLAETFRMPKRPAGILIATYGGRTGHPALFAVRLLRDIEDWPAARRLNELAADYPDEVRTLPITIGPMPIDVNTPDDYQRLQP